MILRIAKKETLEMLRDNRFQWTVGALLVLLTVSFIAGWRHYNNITIIRAEAEASQREQWINKKMGSGHVAAHAGTVVFRPYMQLSAIDKGLDSYVGISMFLEAHRRAEFENEPAEDTATAGQQFGEVTTALTLQLLVPLLIILLAFSTFAGEREQGTLRQILSLGVRRRDLAFGKALGVLLPLLLILVPSTIIGSATLLLSDVSGALPPSPARLVSMILCYLIYFCIFIGISLIVSARSRTSQNALVVLLGLWFVTCLMMPRIAADIGERLYPLPTQEDFLKASEKAREGQPPYAERLAKLEKELVAQYGVKTAKELPVSPSAIELYRQEETGAKIQEANFNWLYDTYAQQNKLYQTLSIFAPLLSAQSLSMAFAGNDTNHHRHFAEFAEKYRYQMAQRMNEDLIGHRRAAGYEAAERAYHERERELYESVPPFQYAAPDWLWTFEKSKLSIALLLAWFVGVLIAASLTISKMRVE